MSIDRSRWPLRLVGALALTLVGLLVPAATAMAEEKPTTRGPISFQPVTVDGTTYKPSGDGPFKTDYPNGIDASKEIDKRAIASIGKRAPNTSYKWGSVGKPQGSFILNTSGGPICKFVLTSTDKTVFDKKEIRVADGWEVDVSPDGKTLTISAKKEANCIPKDGWFWMLVPKSPPANDGPTLEGKFLDKLSLAEPPLGGEDTAVARLDEDLFEDVVAGLAVAPLGVGG